MTGVDLQMRCSSDVASWKPLQPDVLLNTCTIPSEGIFFSVHEAVRSSGVSSGSYDKVWITHFIPGVWNDWLAQHNFFTMVWNRGVSNGIRGLVPARFCLLRNNSPTAVIKGSTICKQRRGDYVSGNGFPRK